MRSYQSDETEGLVHPNLRKEVANKPAQGRWLTIAIVSAVAALGLFAYSSNITTSTTASSTTLLDTLSEQGDVKYNDLDEDTKAQLFDEYRSKFAREYVSQDEQDTKYENFKAFLAKIDERNEAESKSGGSATHGVTIFSDLTETEFKENFLGYKQQSADNKTLKQKIAVPAYTGEKTTVDWSEVLTTAVKDQGYCGSCWAFSATEQLESDSIRTGLLTTSDTLSPQQIVSCDETDLGCDGGDTETAYEYINKVGGMETDTEYPYTSYWGTTGTCSATASDYLVTVTTYYTVEGESDMKSYVLSTGPLSVCLSATTWSSYTGGVVSTCPTAVDHCVQAVGIGKEESSFAGGSSETYWIVRNSWGTYWGDAGYIYLKYGDNTCNISYDPTYVDAAVSPYQSRK